jgi:hypothetical protein
VREICLSFPETSERLSHGAPTFFVRGKKSFVTFMDDHHGDGRLALWCAGPPGAQRMLAGSRPEEFFVPPYVGHLGWIGVRLDRDLSYDEIARVIADAYLAAAPKTVAAAYRERASPRRPRGRSAR